VGFNAGEVTATLTLDREPFQRSMKEAQQEVADFEKGRGVREERVKLTGLEDAKARLKQLDQRVQANVGVKTAEARAELDALERELKKLHRKVEAHVGVEGVPKVLTEIEAVERALSKIDRKRVAPKVDGNSLTRLGGMAQKASGSMGALGLAALALGPAIVPVAAAGTAAMGGLASGLGVAAIGAGSFGMVLKTQLSGISAFSTRINEAQMKVNATFGPAFVKQHAAAVKQLELLQRQLTDRFGPGAIAAVHSWQKMKGALQSFQQSFNPQITSLIVAGTHTITTGLKLLKPVTAAAGNAFVTLTKMAGTALQSPFWKGFFGWMAREAGPAIVALGRIIGNLAHGFAGLMMAFTPMSHGIMNGLVRMTAGFARWATHLGASGGFHKFIAYVRTNGPVLLKTLGDLVRIVLDLGKAFAPYGAVVLKTVEHMLRLADAFVKANPKVAGFALQVVALGLVARRVLSPLGWLLTKGGEFKKWGGIAEVVKRLGTAFTFIRNPALTAAIALGRVGNALALLKGSLVVGGAIRVLGTAFMVLRNPALAAALVFSKVMNVVDKLGPVFSKVWKVVAKLGPAFTALRTAFTAVATGITAAGAAIGVVIAAIVAGGIWMLGHYDLLRKKLFQFFHWISAKWADLSRYLQHVTQEVVAFITNRWDSLVGYLQGIWNGLRAAASSVWGAIRGVVMGAVHAIVGFLTSAWNTATHIVSGAWNAIKGAVSGGIGGVLGLVASLPGRIVSALGDLGKLLWDAGKAVIQGLIDGITSMAGSVVNAVGNVAKGAINSAKGFFGIKSPSTVFHGFGVNLMQGLRNGIHSATPLVIAALRSVSTQMQAHMKGALAAFADRRAHRQTVALDRSPQARELAALTGARDAEAQVSQQNQDAQTMMAARMTDDPAQVAAAQHQIDARKRDERIAVLTQELADKRTAISSEAASAKAGHDAQANSFVAMLGHQTAALEKALAQRHISLARFSEQMRKLLTPLGMTPLALTGGQSHALGHFAPASHDRPRPRLGHGGHRPAAGHVTEHHNYQVNVPPAVAGQHGFDARHASAQLGQALVRHGRHGRRR